MFIKSINKQNKELSLTIYKNNMALIHERRETFKSKTSSTIQYFDISEFAEESSFLINNMNVSEIDFNYIDSYDCNVRVKNNTIAPYNKETKSTSFMIKNLPPNTDEIEVYYLSREISWNYSYNIFLNETTLTINSWFNLRNMSGTSYTNATLKFVAGDINTPTSMVPYERVSALNLTENQGISSNKLDDYYIYSLPNKYSVLNNTIKRIKDFSISNIKYKRYYDFSYYNTKGHIIIEFLNSKENNLGLPLPFGSAYVYYNSNDKFEFIGGNEISDSTLNETISLDIGSAFDVSCKRNILSSKIVDNSEVKEIELIINNNKNKDIEFSICYPIFRNFEILKSTDKYYLNNDSNPCFTSTTKANGDKKIIFSYKTII